MRSTEKEVRHYLPMCYFKYDKDGLDPKTCFYLYDTYGRKVLSLVYCSDPITTQRVIWGKQLLNMTIDMWCEDMKQGLVHPRELDEPVSEMPKWVPKNIYSRTKITIYEPQSRIRGNEGTT